MSRPKPNVLLEHTNRKNYKTDQILESDGIWAVVYQGQPFNMKNFSSLSSYPGPKYKKVSFSNQGPAVNLAKKLNRLFSTTEFSVIKFTNGKQVYPNE